MVQKMSYISIIGHINNLDHAVNNYISQYDIHVENMIYTQDDASNIYAKHFKLSSKYINMVDKYPNIQKAVNTKKALKIIEDIEKAFYEKDEILKFLEKKKQELNFAIKQFENYIDLDITISKLKYFSCIQYKFGKMPISNYMQLNSFLYDVKEIVFIETKKDDVYVYGVYFTISTLNLENKIHSLFDSLNFKEVVLPFTFDDIIFRGSLKKVYDKLKVRLLTVEEKIFIIQEEKLFMIGLNKEDISSAHSRIKYNYQNQSIKNNIKEITNNFFMFSGWIPQEEAETLNKETQKDPKLIFLIDNAHSTINITPPTKLKNNKLFKPFEIFVKTYGLPQYNEIDPTPFVAISYTLLFGFMFGDLGQGFLISILGVYLYKKIKSQMGGVICILGISSMFFGLLYGSVFGFEELIPTIWIKPTKNINTLLLTTVTVGIFLIIVAMVFNILNAIKQKDKVKMFFDSNSITGLTFYISTVSIIALLFVGYTGAALTLITIFIIITIIIFYFKKPIKNKLQGKKQLLEGSSIHIFLLESAIEVFETILTYFTNTLSFVRVGAFAISHASIMGLILLLAHNGYGGHNFIIILLGNILVIAIEGFLVGIQVLRIQFYEMFSRYYKSGGHEFKSCRSQQNMK